MFEQLQSEAKFRARLAGTWLGSMLLLLCLALGPLPCGGAEPVPSKEYQIKAAFVLNFLKFVDWPATAKTNLPPAILIGVVGKTPMGAALEATVRGRTINGRPLRVQQCERPARLRGAQVVFVAASEDKSLDQWLRAVPRTGVLTIGESDSFGTSGGMINFLREEDKVRFDINMKAANQAGLKVSAQLQKLARRVKRKD